MQSLQGPARRSGIASTRVIDSELGGDSGSACRGNVVSELPDPYSEREQVWALAFLVQIVLVSSAQLGGFTLFALAFLLFQQPSIQQLDQLARNRDVEGLTNYLANVPAHNPFSVLKTGGAYAAGQRGWTVKPLTTPDGEKYVVFSTPLIEEDMGELLFKVDARGKLAYVPELDNAGVVLDHHNFDVRFDLPKGILIASDDIQCHWEGRSGKHFFFRISPTYTVRSMVDDLNHPVPYKQAGGIVAVAPRTTKLRFHVHYDGNNLMPGFTGRFGPKEATLSGSVWYLTIAREPAPYEITMHSPSNWTAIAQGNLLSSAVVGNERITKFRNEVPVVWFSASEGPYKTVVDNIGGREYATMSRRTSVGDMHVQNVLNAEVVDFYSKHFIPYPFKRWTALESEQFYGGPGALEAYSFATYPGGGGAFQDSHEPSHTWWGGVLNNNYLRSLWNESFAVFCQGLFARNRPGGNAEEMRLAYVSQQFANPAYNAAPLSDSGDDIGPAAAALGYGKGADVLQMLEDEIGTDTMVQCMKEWIRTNPARHIGSWEDFEKVVKRVTGKDYSWFFTEWVYSSGYPDFSIQKVQWSAPLPKDHILGPRPGLILGQIIFKGPAYKFDADTLVQLQDGTEEYGRIHMIEADNGTHTFYINCAKRPMLVAIDPWGKLLRAKGRDEFPKSLVASLFQFKTYVDPAHVDYLKPVRSQSVVTDLPTDLANTILIGSPDTLPAMGPLCHKVGFEVLGNTLTYKGTKIDLEHGGALALVDLPDGKTCMIGLGKIAIQPDMGRARLLVMDQYGRPLRAKTDPMTTGPLTHQFTP